MNVFIEFALTLLLAVVAALGTATLAPRLLPKLTRATPARTADILFLLFALAYILVFSSLSILRHQSFHSGGFDLGIFDQNIWNSLHGRLFQAPLPLQAQVTLGQHFSPLLLAIVPLYALWADARTLLVLQAVALATTALPLYWFARQRLGRALALVVAAALFLSPALQSVNLWEFHEIALATPLLAFALYFLLNQQTRPFLGCLGLALLLKEEAGLIIASFGAYALCAQRKRWLGIGLAVIGVAWTVIMLLYVIPSFRDPAYGLDYQYVDRHQYLGRSVPEIISTILPSRGSSSVI